MTPSGKLLQEINTSGLTWDEYTNQIAISHKEEIQSAFDSPQEQVNKNKSEANEEFSGNRRMRRLQAKAKRKKRK